MGKIDDSGARMSYGEKAAIREPSTGKGRYDLVTPFGTRRLAEWYELGAEKYEDRNWEKGMPFSRYVNSAKRHLDKFVMGMNDEDHLAAAAWNIFAIMHHQELGQLEFDDMPHYLDGEKNKETDNSSRSGRRAQQSGRALDSRAKRKAQPLCKAGKHYRMGYIKILPWT